MRKTAGEPVDVSVAAIFLAMRPDLPMPVTITRLLEWLNNFPALATDRIISGVCSSLDKSDAAICIESLAAFSACSCLRLILLLEVF